MQVLDAAAETVASNDDDGIAEALERLSKRHEGGTCRWGRQRKAAEPVAYEPIIWVVFACSSSIHPWFSACSMCEVVRYWVP